MTDDDQLILDALATCRDAVLKRTRILEAQLKGLQGTPQYHPALIQLLWFRKLARELERRYDQVLIKVMKT